ncbi:hypothetical protein [Paraburkholderia sp. A1RO-5L]|uniref:hypothetical protein n=1 Tax=Paraburkholderia sp. A1RO-5L TaxID=3028370 RepID=UPI003B7C8E8A
MTTTTKNRSPKEAATMSKTEDLAQRIAAARLHLNTVLLEGGNTAGARALLKKLQAEQDALNAVAADLEAAKRALAQIEQDRINESAQTLLEARNARVASIASRFAVRPLFA